MSLRGVRGRQYGSRASADGIACARSECVILPYFACGDQRLSGRGRGGTRSVAGGGRHPFGGWRRASRGGTLGLL
ncbi:hypothetical protein GCM10018781_73470 [Kitasatospora indigofera]|uniref:Uncharacterized protein n=1 Tax=Kitasatospora indigofera TaxID=67307 RepID=A0A919GH60_9ACTN|nr:hypothetical protein GCM10018781_73470 [Kitasatospora indigofera]